VSGLLQRPLRVVEVPFGDPGGAPPERLPLGWAQWAIWRAIRATAPDDAYFNIGRVVPVAARIADAGVAAVARAVAVLVERHEALRTRLCDPGEHPEQGVHTGGVLRVDVVEVDPLDPVDAAARAAERHRELAAVRFDHVVDWPVRVSLVVAQNRVTHVVLVLSHVAVDGHGADVVARELRLLLLRGTLPPLSARTPRQVVAHQRSTAGARMSAAAVEQWVESYSRMPPTAFPPHPGTRLTPRFWSGLLTSPALEAAAGVLAARHRCSTSTVLLTAVSAVVAATGGHPTAGVHVIVNNRFAPELRDTVAMLSLDGLFVLDVPAGSTLDDLLVAARGPALRAYRHAQYDVPAMTAALAACGRRRGVGIDPQCCFNDQRVVDGAGSARRAGEDDVAARLAGLRAATTFVWRHKQESLNCGSCFHVVSTPAGLGLALTADTVRLSPERIRAALLAVEHIVIRAAVGSP
jgi:hypothetical protein